MIKKETVRKDWNSIVRNWWKGMKQTLQQPHIHTSANSEIETWDIIPSGRPLQSVRGSYQNPHSICIIRWWTLRLRHRRTSGYDTECHFPSVTCVKAVGAGQIPKRWENRILLSGWHACGNYSRTGTGSCTGINMNFKSRLAHRTNYGYTKKREDRTP